MTGIIAEAPTPHHIANILAPVIALLDIRKRELPGAWRVVGPNYGLDAIFWRLVLWAFCPPKYAGLITLKGNFLLAKGYPVFDNFAT